MEIKLNFKEEEFRNLYENSYTLVQGELEKKVNERKKTRNVLLLLCTFTFLLTFAHKDWIYYALIFLIIILFFIGWTELMKLKTMRLIQRNRKEVDDFVAKTKLKKDIKYSWNDNAIHYCESDEVVDTYRWNDLTNVENNPDYFRLYFSNNKPTIMIPRTMVDDKRELKKFESKIEENLKNDRNKGI